MKTIVEFIKICKLKKNSAVMKSFSKTLSLYTSEDLNLLLPGNQSKEKKIDILLKQIERIFGILKKQPVSSLTGADFLFTDWKIPYFRGKTASSLILLNIYQRNELFLMNIIQVETVLILRERYMYPKNKEEFFKFIKELDKDIKSVERILKKDNKITFSIEKYYLKNTDLVDDVIKNVI